MYIKDIIYIQIILFIDYKRHCACNKIIRYTRTHARTCKHITQ
jgi:hypothetical protein